MSLVTYEIILLVTWSNNYTITKAEARSSSKFTIIDKKTISICRYTASVKQYQITRAVAIKIHGNCLLELKYHLGQSI